MSVALANAITEQPFHIQAIFALGVLLVSASLLIGLRNRKRRGPTHITAREQLERAKSRQGMRDDLEQLAIEIEAMARRVGAQLDNQSTRLESLLRQAEQRIARLESLQDQLLNGTPGSHHTPASQAKPTPSPTSAAPSTPGSPDRLMHDVHRLADAGHGADDIAKALDQPIGKVELILALRKA